MFNIVVKSNPWNVTGGQALTNMVVATIVPVSFAVFENFGAEYITELKIIPAVTVPIVGVFVLGSLLHPIQHKVQRKLDSIRLKRLGDVVKQIPDIVESLVRSTSENEREEAIRRVLDDKKLKFRGYVLYTRWGYKDGGFRPLVGTKEVNAYPKLEISALLIEQLVKERTFIDVQQALRDPRYITVSPELWRIQRCLGSEKFDRRNGDKRGGGSDEMEVQRCRYLLPIAIGDAVCGLLIVGNQELDNNVRSDPFTRVLQVLGVAAA